MSIKAFMTQTKRLKRLEGEKCAGAITGKGEPVLFVSFGTLYPPDAAGHIQAEKRVIIECPWRLETENEVVAGSGDKVEVSAPKVQVLVDKQLIETTVYPPSYTARLTFEGGLTLWLFPVDTRDYAVVRTNPWVHWYVVGRAVPNAWEED